MKNIFSFMLACFASHMATAQKLEPDYQKLGKLLQPNSMDNNTKFYREHKSILEIEDLKDIYALQEKLRENKNVNLRTLENAMPVFVPEKIETMPVYIPEPANNAIIPNPGKRQ